MDTVIRNDEEWRLAAEEFVAHKQAAEQAAKAAERAKSRLAGLTQHNMPTGLWRGRLQVLEETALGKQEVRVTLLKPEPQP